MDVRWKKLAELLVQHSAELNRGEKVMIAMVELETYPLVQALYEACINGEISEKDALHYADSANEVRLMLKLGDRRPGARDRDQSNMSLAPE